MNSFTTSHSTPWSETLQQQTREAIEHTLVTLNSFLHFKHAHLGYATVLQDELYQGRLLLNAEAAAKAQLFDDVEDLLQAG